MYEKINFVCPIHMIRCEFCIYENRNTKTKTIFLSIQVLNQSMNFYFFLQDPAVEKYRSIPASASVRLIRQMTVASLIKLQIGQTCR